MEEDIMKFKNESGEIQDDKKEQKKEDLDYLRLIAAQNESERRIKIKNIQRTITEEKKEKILWAIISGVSIAGLFAATHFAHIDPSMAVKTEIQALNSWDAAKEYIKMITPAMWTTLVASAASISQYVKHNKKMKKANQDFYDMDENEPKDLQDIVESQAKR